jgi:arylsulfatase A-like enzyme
MIARLARLQRQTIEAALLAWPLWIAFAELRASDARTAHGLLLVAGSSALWLLLGSTALALALVALPRAAPAPQAIDRRAWIAAAIACSATVALGWTLGQLPPFWVPSSLAFRSELHRAASFFLAGGVSGAALVLAAGRGAGRRETLRWPAGLALLVAAGLSTPSIVLSGRSYLVYADLAVLGALLVSLLGCSVAARWWRSMLWLLGVAALSALIALFARPDFVRAQPRLAGVHEAIAIAAQLFDLDRDGSPAVLGGNDCDDFDPQVHPAALELVANGRDDNCFGGDLAAAAAVPRLTMRPGHAPRSLVLISVDALRADMAAPGPGGAARHMPELARFARSSAHFANHYSHASFTNDALGALMSGEYPMSFAELGEFIELAPTLAELLRAAGYHTATVNQASPLPSWYVYRGFSDVDIELAAKHDGYRAVTSGETTRRAIARLERARASGKPFFFWVHYMDPHLEYMPHAGTPFAGTGMRARYEQEVWSTDREIGKLLRHLEASGFLEDGITVVTADHGEQLDPDAMGHSYFISEDVLRTPLVLRARGVPAEVLTARVRTIDLYPTLLELTAGIGAGGAGRHLAPVWQGRERDDRDVYARTSYKDWSLRAALVGRYKLVHDLRTGQRSLHDLRGGGERIDLFDRQPAIAADLTTRMGRVWDVAINDVVLARKLRARSGR